MCGKRTDRGRRDWSGIVRDILSNRLVSPELGGLYFVSSSRAPYGVGTLLNKEPFQARLLSVLFPFGHCDQRRPEGGSYVNEAGEWALARDWRLANRDEGSRMWVEMWSANDRRSLCGFPWAS